MIIRKIPWTSQPQTPVGIDWSNPFKVVSAFTPIAQTGWTETASPTDIVSSLGREKYFSASNASLYRLATEAEKTPSASILWMGDLKGTPSTAACLGGTTYTGTNITPYVGIEIKRRYSTANNLFLAYNLTTAQNIQTSGTSYTTGKYLIIGTVTSGNQKLYVKNLTTGAIEKVTASVSGDIIYTSTARVEVGDSFNARDPAAACALQALAGRAWSESEVAQLLQNPWQIFEPIQRRIYVPSSGAVTHATTGALTGAGSEIAGTAARTRQHVTTGDLQGPGSTIAGTAAHIAVHATTGALSGQGSALEGTAARTREHATSGDLAGTGAELSGTAVYNAKHATTGVLEGQGATVSGSASRTAPGATTHDTSGALTGPGSVIDGVAARTRQHATTGDLAGPGSEVAGTAAHIAKHDTAGALTGQGSTLSGTTAHVAIHATSGALTGQGSALSGTAAGSGVELPVQQGAGGGVVRPRKRRPRFNVDEPPPRLLPKTHMTSGALIGQGARLSGTCSVIPETMRHRQNRRTLQILMMS